jgi:hypothetical protein
MARILSLEEIEELEATTRTKGEYAIKLDEFVKSGDVAWDFSEIFRSKEAEAIRNSVNQNAQKHSHDKGWPLFKVMIDKKFDPAHCVVVNMVKLVEMQTAPSENGTDPAA